MRAAEFEKLRALGETHWWFLGRKYLLRALLESESTGREMLILDAGRGTGIAEEELGRLGTVVGIDIAQEAVAPEGSPALGLLSIASVEAAPFPDGTFDLVVALDLLEHLDDARALRELHRICRPGARLLITVPAYNWLWSRHDQALGHRRRYSAGDLRRRISDAGFAVSKLSYAVTVLFPLAAGFRLVRRLFGGAGSDLFEVPRMLNSVLALLMRVEAGLLRHLNLPFGLSVLAIGIKAQGAETDR